MLDKKDMQAVSELMDEKLGGSEGRMSRVIDEKISASEERMSRVIDEKISASEERMSQVIDEKISASEERMSRVIDERVGAAERRMQVLLENTVNPRFDLVMEALAGIREQLVPRSRVDDLEDEVKFLKTVVRQMAERVSALERAN